MVKFAPKETDKGRDRTAFFVVITITPLPALAPHTEAAAASFRTVMLCTSAGLMSVIEPSYGKLSTTIKGSLGPLIELSPRMVIGGRPSRVSITKEEVMLVRRSIILDPGCNDNCFSLK